MAETNGPPLLQSETLRSLHAALDPKSLILSQFSDSGKPQFLQLKTEGFIMERGPRYNEYSALRNKRLRMKSSAENQTPEKETEEKLHNRSVLTPPKKQVKFSSNFTTPPRRGKGSSILTQSVPDFSSALRKENRKPAAVLPPVSERSVTPPAVMKSGKMYGKLGVGSNSTNSMEKRSGGLMSRKSYANMEELNGINNAENRGRVGRGGGIGKTVFGCRQL